MNQYSPAHQYVDLDYEGNGAGEYMYYDRETGRYSDAACKAAAAAGTNGSAGRCVKMDCHEPTTHYSLLGFFKHVQYGAFLDALVGYQGDCVWTDAEYTLMMATTAANEGDAAESSWPLTGQCTATGTDGVYYDMKPGQGGKIDLGLYADDSCTVEYTGGAVTVDDVWESASASSSDGKTGQERLKAWNDALGAFHVCQPCMTYDLVSLTHHGKDTSKTTVNGNGDRYGDAVQQQDCAAEEEEGCNQDGGGGPFVCGTADPINQCQVFARDAGLLRASYHDVVVAESQRTVASVNAAGVQLGEPPKTKHSWLSILLLLAGMALFFFALCHLYKKDQTRNKDLDEPLVGRNNKSDTAVPSSPARTSSAARTSSTNKVGSNKVDNSDGVGTSNGNSNTRSGSTRSVGRT
jgi:hypothetical protein